MSSRFGSIGTQYLNNAGDPLINGLIYVYEPGTNTPKDTFADLDLTIPNSNPIELTAAGRQPNVWFNGSARMILATSDGTQVEVRDPVGTAAGTNAAFAVWASGDTYVTGDLVRGSNGKYYVSLTNDNTGNDPISSAGSWTQVKFTRVFNTNETYSEDDIAQSTLDGLLYRSKTNSNTGNEPSTDTTNWEPAVDTSGSGGGGTVMQYNSELIEATTTHNWPDGFAGTVLISGAAGGGGGGAISGDAGYGGGGGDSCARISAFIDQSITASTLITIGAGGPGGATGTNHGSPGGETVVAGIITLTGGAAGLSNPAASSPADGADGVVTEYAASPSGEGGRYVTGGGGGQGNDTGGSAGGEGGAGMTENYRCSSLTNTGEGGNPTGGDEGGGGGGSYGDGGASSAPTENRGGGGRGGNRLGAGQNGADGFILLEWWEPVSS